MTFAPLETVYAGHRFRSRTEARWAVFFDALGIRWGYETEGFSMDGLLYLPDFLLSDLDLWVEIKGQSPNKEELLKGMRLSLGTKRRVLFLFGEQWPGRHGSLLFDGHESSGGTETEFVECHLCAQDRALRLGDGSRLTLGPPCGCRRSGTYTDAAMDAYNAARHARFEHGENGVRQQPTSRGRSFSAMHRSQPLDTSPKISEETQALESELVAINNQLLTAEGDEVRMLKARRGELLDGFIAKSVMGDA